MVILLAQTDLYSGNPDHLGAVFEAQEFGNQANGQFLTPWHVCELMAKMSPGDNSVTILRSIVSHADRSPSLGESVLDQMIDGLALSRVLREIEKPGFGRFVDDYLIPALENGWQPIEYNDPCIGSGRTLLAAAAQYPGWMHYFGLVRFTGQDIDQTMCLISRINFRLCGLNGWGLRFNAGLDERTRANIRRRLDRTPSPQYVVQNGRVVAIS